jgi:hypothetical protein
MPRFVVLRHEPPVTSERTLHWDLMLESEGVLRTWALSCEPRLDATIAGQQLPDHRAAYLDYEGPISGDRGVVQRWDVGTYEVQRETGDELQITLRGDVLHCVAQLRCVDAARHRWDVSFSAAVPRSSR